MSIRTHWRSRRRTEFGYSFGQFVITHALLAIGIRKLPGTLPRRSEPARARADRVRTRP